jgi:hypothetical protein
VKYQRLKKNFPQKFEKYTNQIKSSQKRGEINEKTE